MINGNKVLLLPRTSVFGLKKKGVGGGSANDLTVLLGIFKLRQFANETKNKRPYLN